MAANRRWSILLADNKADFVATRAEYLTAAGYRVVIAGSEAEARRVLTEEYVHLAILDIRLENDDDEHDVSGLRLAKDPGFRRVPKIILTAFPNYQAVVDALGPVATGLPPAVDFLAKDEGPEEMLRRVERALKTYLGIDWELQIDWGRDHPLSALHLVAQLDRGASGETLMQRADELEGLIRQVFSRYRQIRIRRVMWRSTGRFCLEIWPQSAENATDQRLLVCGERQRINTEIAHFRDLSPTAVPGVRLLATRETVHYGTILYELPGADLEQVQTLKDLCQGGGPLPGKAIEHLLRQVLPEWHKRGQTVDESSDLMTLYRRRVGLEGDGLTREEVERRVQAVCQAARPLSAVDMVRGNASITFHFPQQEPLVCPDPVAAAYRPLAWQPDLAVCKISPGRLTADNVLVDGNQRAWLTDLAEAGQAPQWWDYVCLEAIVRFVAGQAPDLTAWEEFETSLMAPTSLTGGVPHGVVINSLLPSVTLIEKIRWAAANETGQDLLPYYAGLLVWTIRAMADYDPATVSSQKEKLSGAHLLLAASLLSRWLALSESGQVATSPATAVPELRLAADGVTVFRGEQLIVDMGKAQRALFRCLYEADGQAVSRRNLIEEVYQERYDPTDQDQAGKLTQLVSQVNKKLETGLADVEYIVAVREQGYRLDRKGRKKEH